MFFVSQQSALLDNLEWREIQILVFTIQVLLKAMNVK